MSILKKAGELCAVRPALLGAQPWLGVVVDPRKSEFGTMLRQEDLDHWVIVRCTEPASARGIVHGSEYLVRAAFLHEPLSPTEPASPVETE